MSWQEVTLNEICDAQYGYTASATDDPVGPKFLRITDIVNESINWDAVPYCQINETDIDRYLLKTGDIVIARTGATTGYAKLIRDDVNSVFASYLIRLKLNQDIAYPGFVGRLLESDVYKKFIEGVKGGAAQPNANAKTLTLFQFKLPDLETQKKISETLSFYDSLIENNQRRIKLLEESARLLYREWFINFRFPSHEHAAYDADGFPSGWKKAELKDICDDIRESVKPEEVSQETPYIGLEHLPRRSITLADWETADKVTSNKFLFKENDILFGKIRPYFHKVGFALVNGIASSDSIVIRARKELYYPYLLCLLSSDAFIALASKTVKEGSKMPRADWKYLKAYKASLPPENLLQSFNEIMLDILSQLKNLAFYNKKLAAARDILLPRLMNGELIAANDMVSAPRVAAKQPTATPAKAKANDQFKEAVLISLLTDRFGSAQYPLGRKRYTKLSYLVHRRRTDDISGYARKAAGPYNSKTRYQGPEKIAIENQYVQEAKNGKFTGFVSGPKIDDVRNRYGETYLTDGSLDWVEQNFRYKSNDELELLTTVDHALLELTEKGAAFAVESVKNILDSHKDWKPKLKLAYFSDRHIQDAIQELATLFIYKELA